ncbi:hypothetical protein N0V95_007227 [Ascochyta clinopodiicola]|nr:hypothetical protein N0V95_007227 [Ascochyta clinopodiicola]
MDRVTLGKLTRRVAFILITILQLAHVCLVMNETWTPPRKRHPKTTTMATLTQLAFITDSCFSIMVRNMDVKLGRQVIRGLGIDVLFWGLVIWSAALVGVDIAFSPSGLMNLTQLFALDVLMWTAMLSSFVALVARSDGGEPAVDEKGDELIVDEKRDEKVNEKEEV